MLSTIILLTILTLANPYEIATGQKQSLSASQYGSHGEKSDSGYIGRHQAEKGQQGHHAKENQRRQYAEEAGARRGHDHKDAYYGRQNQGQKGSKGYHYADEGSYAKGHKTKGRHNVHKLNEFKKDTDFFDEGGKTDLEERHGGYEAAKKVATGDLFDKGRFSSGFGEGRYGVKGFSDNGQRFFSDKGHKFLYGDDGFYGIYGRYGQEGGKNGFREFGLEKHQH